MFSTVRNTICSFELAPHQPFWECKWMIISCFAVGRSIQEMCLSHIWFVENATYKVGPPTWHWELNIALLFFYGARTLNLIAEWFLDLVQKHLYLMLNSSLKEQQKAVYFSFSKRQRTWQWCYLGKKQDCQ